jgi:hypothetical protein
MNTRLLPALAVALLVSACGGQPPAAQSPAPAASAAAAPAGSADSAASAAPSPSAAASDAPLPEPIATAIGRVRGMMDAVDDAKIKEAFSPKFLESVSPAQITAVFTDIRKNAGACSGQQALRVKGTNMAQFLITCEHGQLDAKLIVDANAPYLIQGLLIKPAQN